MIFKLSLLLGLCRNIRRQIHLWFMDDGHNKQSLVISLHQQFICRQHYKKDKTHNGITGLETTDNISYWHFFISIFNFLFILGWWRLMEVSIKSEWALLYKEVRILVFHFCHICYIEIIRSNCFSSSSCS